MSTKHGTAEQLENTYDVLKRVRADGSKSEILIDDYDESWSIANVHVINGRIYYEASKGFQYMDIERKQPQILFSFTSMPSEIFIHNGFIYYCDPDLMRISLDGSVRDQLASEITHMQCVFDSKILYTDLQDTYYYDLQTGPPALRLRLSSFMRGAAMPRHSILRHLPESHLKGKRPAQLPVAT